jgi:hypothetical protein
MIRALALVALAGGVAHATPDLRVSEAPPRATPTLRMRPLAQVATPAAPPSATLVEAPETGSGVRALEAKVVFHVRAGVALDGTPTSGKAMRTGAVPGEDPGDPAIPATALRAANSYALGDAVLGTRGLPVSSLNTYFSAQFRLGITGVSQNAMRPDGWDELGDSALLIQTGYAELDGYGDAEHVLHPLFVRAGRQFHIGGGEMISQFDGAQVGWQRPDWEVGGFVGRRVSLWLDTDEDGGLLAGGNVRVALERLVGLPLTLTGDALAFGSDTLVIAGGAQVALGPAKVSLSARAIDVGDGLGLARVSSRVRWPIGELFYLRADLDVIRAHEWSYDWLAPAPVDIVDVRQNAAALALPQPADALRLGGSLSWAMTDTLELYGFGRASFADDTGFDSTWLEAGGAAEASLLESLTLTVQGKARHHLLDDTGGAGQPFGDLTGSGVTDFIEAAGELRYRPRRGLVSGAVGAYARRYDLRSPYVEIRGDLRAGARADLAVELTSHARLRATAEAAQLSTALSPEVGTVYALRVLAEASF